jgi:hypothetical protein
MNVAKLIDHIKWDESPMGREYWQCLYQAFYNDCPLNEGDDDETPQRSIPTFSSGSVTLDYSQMLSWRTPPIPTSNSAIVNEYSISIADALTQSVRYDYPIF